nr:DUF983 domain-containing protein [Pedobacter xinjiangensis]
MARTPKLKALINSKCPRCRRGDIFFSPVYSYRQKMNELCPSCGFKFEIEPGYFYAAMYVSYALSVGETIIAGMLTFWLSGKSESPLLYLGVIFGLVLVLSPFNYRYSRVILLHKLTPRIKYNPDLDKE